MIKMFLYVMLGVGLFITHPLDAREKLDIDQERFWSLLLNRDLWTGADKEKEPTP